MGGQISLKVHSHKCQTQPWGLNAVCNAWVAPAAIWQGSTTGLWLGWILGAFVSGLATRKTFQENEAIAFTRVPPAGVAEETVTKVSLCADDLELTSGQREALRRFLILLMVKLGSSSDAASSKSETLSFDELQHIAAVAAQQSLIKEDLTLEEARQLFLTLCARTLAP